MKYEAIILAGASAENFDTTGQIKSRAMIKIGDKTMLDWVAGAIFESDKISRTCVVGDVKTLNADKILKPKENIVENIRTCLDEFVEGDYVLLATSDIPLLTTRHVTEFLTVAEKIDADFIYPICEKQICNTRYSELKRTYVKIKEGEFTGGNIMLMKTSFLRSILPIMESLFAARKSPLKLARMLGCGVIFKLILSRINPNILTLTYLEETVSRIMKAKVKAFITETPEICEDLDSPDDFEIMKKLIKIRY